MCLMRTTTDIVDVEGGAKYYMGNTRAMLGKVTISITCKMYLGGG